MANGWGFALQSAANGYLKGMQIREDQEDREYRREKRGRERKDLAEADALRADLRAVGNPVPVATAEPPVASIATAVADGASLPAAQGAEGAPAPATQPTGAARWEPVLDIKTEQSTSPQNQAGTSREGLAMAAMSGALDSSGQPAANRRGGMAMALQSGSGAPDPAATQSRLGQMADVYMKHGQVEKAVALQEQQLRIQQQQALTQETALKLKNAGVMDALAKFRLTGDPGAAKTALAGAGFPVDGDITVAPAQVEVPGLGKINAYQASFNMKGPDGKVQPVTINSHQATMAMMPYEKSLALLEKGAEQQAANAKAGQTQSNWLADRAMKQDEMRLKREELADKGKDREQAGVDKQVNSFATQLDKSNIPQFDALLSDIEGTIGRVKDIPGYGQTGGLPAFMLTDEGKVLRQKISQLQNLTLKDRSGAAVTNQELGRLLNELGTGAFSTDDQLRTGLGQVRRNLDAAKRNFIAGVNDSVLKEYQARGGMALHRGEASAPSGAPGGSAKGGGVDRPGLEAELRKRGLLK